MTKLDLKLTDDKEIDLTNLKPVLLSGTDYIKQKLNIKLDTYFGEWFLDTRKGVKWKQLVLKKGYNLSEIELHVRNIIKEVDEVREILEYSQSLTGLKLTINFKVSTTESDTVQILKEVPG